MNDEVPKAIRAPSKKERSAAAKLSEEDLKIIDANILGNSRERWLKVARVVTDTEKALREQFPDFTIVFYTHRLCWLIDQGRLEVQGYPLYIRFSEVRLPQCGHQPG